MTAKAESNMEDLERISGIPPKGKLGASKNEMMWLVVGVVVFALISLAFWWQAAH